MNRTADVVIVGAGVIGSATAFELAKRGYKTLNIDKLPASGYGSTSNSCAIVRAHYSTWDGVAMAYEGFFYWDDWNKYLEVEDERGMAKYMKTGSIMFMLKGADHSKKSLNLFKEIGVEHEIWDLETLKKKMPIYSMTATTGPAVLMKMIASSINPGIRSKVPFGPRVRVMSVILNWQPITSRSPLNPKGENSSLMRKSRRFVNQTDKS